MRPFADLTLQEFFSQTVFDGHDIPHVWANLLGRRLLYFFWRELRRFDIPADLDEQSQEVFFIAWSTSAMLRCQEQLLPEIPVMLDRFQRTKKHKFSEEKLSKLLQIADRVLKPELVDAINDALFGVDHAV